MIGQAVAVVVAGVLAVVADLDLIVDAVAVGIEILIIGHAVEVAIGRRLYAAALQPVGDAVVVVILVGLAHITAVGVGRVGGIEVIIVRVLNGSTAETERERSTH
jgi:hypothetical protein